MATGSGSRTRASSFACADDRYRHVTNDILRTGPARPPARLPPLLFVLLYRFARALRPTSAGRKRPRAASRPASVGSSSSSRPRANRPRGGPADRSDHDHRRDLNSTIFLDDEFASGTHAALTFRGRARYVEDRGARGTWVNGHRIQRPVALSYGDELTVGRVRFRALTVYRLAARRVELALLVPVLLLVPLGVLVTNIAQSGVAQLGPMAVAIAFVLADRGGPRPSPGRAIGATSCSCPRPRPRAPSGWSCSTACRRTSPATRAEPGHGGHPAGVVRRGPGAMVAVAIGLRDDGFLRTTSTRGAGAALLLVITFLFGTEINDARLWIVVGPFGFQPSEAIKVMLVIFLAGYLAENRAVLAGASLRLGPLSLPPLPYLAPMLVVFAGVMLVVVVSRDLGTALLFFGVFLTMLFVATGRRAYVLFGMLLFVAGAAVARPVPARRRADQHLARPVGRPERRRLPDGAHLRLRPGRPAGEGLGQGLPEINGVLPIPVHTDMIFAAIGEELGLLGGVAVLALVAMIMARGLRIAVLARDDFSTMLAAGLTAGLVAKA